MEGFALYLTYEEAKLAFQIMTQRLCEERDYIDPELDTEATAVLQICAKLSREMKELTERTAKQKEDKNGNNDEVLFAF